MQYEYFFVQGARRKPLKIFRVLAPDSQTAVSMLVKRCGCTWAAQGERASEFLRLLDIERVSVENVIRSSLGE
jgi:hypothetical protein